MRTARGLPWTVRTYRTLSFSSSLRIPGRFWCNSRLPMIRTGESEGLSAIYTGLRRKCDRCIREEPSSDAVRQKSQITGIGQGTTRREAMLFPEKIDLEP